MCPLVVADRIMTRLRARCPRLSSAHEVLAATRPHAREERPIHTCIHTSEAMRKVALPQTPAGSWAADVSALANASDAAFHSLS